MAGLNRLTIVGNVGRDPEMRYTQAGVAVCSFSVAVTERWGQGEARQEKTTWFRCSAWNKQAELANTLVKKGQQILVEGSIEASAYTDKSGAAAASLEVRVTNFQLLGRKEDNGAGASDDAGNGGGSNVDEIPF